MKRMAIAALLAFGALSLFADEKTTTQAPAPATPADSPLVAAAKASTRPPAAKSKKKKTVITNDTLAKSGGHLTTTSKGAQQPLPPPPVVDPAVAKLAADKKASAERDAAKKAKAQALAEKKKRDAEHINAVIEGDDPDGIYADPATTEGVANRQSSPPVEPPPTVQATTPPTVQVQKPPL